MKIVCLCCTHMRPQQLVNVIRDFELFDYPDKQLLILDDAGQYPSEPSGPGWSIISRRGKYRTLGEKCNALLAQAPADSDAFVVIDDDDGYCKWTLRAHAESLSNADVSFSGVVMEDQSQPDKYNLVSGRLKTGRIIYHGSWAFTPDAIKKAGGYPHKDAGADRELMLRFIESGARIVDACENFPPYYVYRRHNSGAAHISTISQAEKNRLNQQYLTADPVEQLPSPTAPNWSAIMRVQIGCPNNQSAIKYWQQNKESVELGSITVSKPTADLVSIRDLRRNKTVTACMASIPSREDALQRTVASLINQVDALMIHLNGYAAVPQYLNHPKIEVVAGDNSLGANSKFHYVDDLSGYVFICDDDLLYPADYVQKMQRGIDAYRCLIGASGNSIIDSYPVKSYLKGIEIHPLQRELKEDTNADVVGTGTLGFHTEDLKLKSSEIIYRNRVDLSLMRVARRDKLQRKIIKHPHRWITRSTNDHGLHEENLADDSESTGILNEILKGYPEKVYTGRRITVVLINFKRTRNTHQIIERLRTQTVQPAIYVWNNGNKPFDNPHADWVINSSQNAHAHCLPFLYQHAETEYICRMDDDLVPADNRVLEDVIRFIDEHGKSRRIVGGQGIILEAGKNYENSTPVGCGKYYRTVVTDTPVDIIKGRFMVFRQEFADLIPLDRSHIHVDLTTSFALSGQRRLFHVVPALLENRLSELPDAHDDGSGRGYSHLVNHYETRNRLTEGWRCW